MLARTTGAALLGVRGVAIGVEVEAGRGLPGFHLVGCADRVVAESRDRIRAAFRQSGVEFPAGRVTVNLAPSELPKSGSALDLAIAVGIAATQLELPPERLAEALFVGELGLDGRVRGVRGALALLSASREFACAEAIVSSECLAEASLYPELPLRGAACFAQVLEHLRGEAPLPAAAPGPAADEDCAAALELGDVAGQEGAKRALAAAAAGGHNLLLVGPPGTGKTMLAERLPGLLPPLTAAESLEVTQIHSVAGALAAAPLRRPPFRAPHHSASAAGLLGGGQPLRPGEISLAHRGVLFLDELPEWRRSALEALRQPLESGVVWIARARGSLPLPARFQLVAAMNPCPCGQRGNAARECCCDPALIRRYLGRLSGPLLDRIDLHVPVPAQPGERPWGTWQGPGSAELRASVGSARARQRARCGVLNASLARAALLEHCRPDAPGEQLLERAAQRMGLSLRAQARVLRVARTLCDLDERDRVDAAAVAEAIALRGFDAELGPGVRS